MGQRICQNNLTIFAFASTRLLYLFSFIRLSFLSPSNLTLTNYLSASLSYSWRSPFLHSEPASFRSFSLIASRTRTYMCARLCAQCVRVCEWVRGSAMNWWMYELVVRTSAFVPPQCVPYAGTVDYWGVVIERLRGILSVRRDDLKEEIIDEPEGHRKKEKERAVNHNEGDKEKERRNKENLRDKGRERERKNKLPEKEKGKRNVSEKNRTRARDKGVWR